MTGAHHARELVSVQMPLYTILDLLHGLVHGDAETLEILKRNKIFTIPIVNIDGSFTIYEHYKKTGELLLKRKNNNRSNEQYPCDVARQGVDINRNYGYLWGNNLSPCDESYAGPQAFSEPETIAIRAMLYKYINTIKFVYNFHAFGPMYIWPYNGEIKNELHESNPEAEHIFNEIADARLFPATILTGNAIKTVGYKADGECNDYILKNFNIPSVSPELGNDNVFSSSFFLEYDFVTREVLRDNHPWIKYTIEKLGGEVSLMK
jgi:carboxypeptidase T